VRFLTKLEGEGNGYARSVPNELFSKRFAVRPKTGALQTDRCDVSTLEQTMKWRVC